jgi:hypothetical protein
VALMPLLARSLALQVEQQGVVALHAPASMSSPLPDPPSMSWWPVLLCAHFSGAMKTLLSCQKALGQRAGTCSAPEASNSCQIGCSSVVR